MPTAASAGQIRSDFDNIAQLMPDRDRLGPHGRNETYLTLGEVERVAREELPQAQVRGHLLWRYTIIWRKRS